MAPVLVIDDCAEFRELMAHALGLDGLHPYAFSSALTALEFIKESVSQPFLIFVDTNMPDMSGPDFILQARNLKRNASLRIVLMSASSELEKTARQIGADEFLKKPFELDALFNLVAIPFVSELERP